MVIHCNVASYHNIISLFYPNLPEVLLQYKFQLPFNNCTHRIAFAKIGCVEMGVQFFPQHLYLVAFRQFIFRHNTKQFHQLFPACNYAVSHGRLFFCLILFYHVFAQCFQYEVYKLKIFFVKLRKIQVLPAFIGLLVEVDCPDAVLVIFYIRSDVNYKIVTTHIAQQPGKTTFIEFYKFLGNPDLVCFRLVEVIFQEHISGNAGNMFFHQCFLWYRNVMRLGLSRCSSSSP